MRRSLLIVATAAVVALAWVSPAGALSTTPAYAGDFPDPSVLLVGSTYWAYSTGSGGRNLQVMSSPDLRTWSPPVDPLPALPSWATPGLTWAPSVVAVGGTFLMYYTVHAAASGRQCISVAASPSPAGPFTDTSSGPLLCQLTAGGSIDPDPMVTSTGTYLVWKSDDNALGAPTHLWSQRLAADGRSLVGSPSLLLSAGAGWQRGVIEGPSMVQAQGLYYLFYGGGAWDSASAGIGYAWCTSPLGPCANGSSQVPWMSTHGAAVGPSGPDVFVNRTGTLSLAYHAWTGAVGYQNGGVRSLWVDGLRLVGVPQVA